MGRALISDDTARETAPAARRRERDDESHEDIHAHGPIIGLSDSPAVSARLDRHRRDAPAELIVARKSFASATTVLKSSGWASHWL